MMKTKARIWENIVVLLIGVTLIWLNASAGTLPTMVRIIGAGFVIPAIINVISLYKRSGDRDAAPAAETPKSSCESGDGKAPKGKVAMVMSWILSVGAILLGIVLLSFPDLFVQALVYILAAAVIIGGGYHFYIIGRGYHPVTFPAWFFALPVAIILTGAYVIFTTGGDASRNVELIILGSGLVMFALLSFLEVIAYATFSRKLRGSGKVTVAQPEATDEPVSVEAEEIHSSHGTFE